ncbi:hypothetical protein L0B70_04195 [Kaistella sp. 97-N-M2]|uniref:hypothetical protein n=1 Tax=Kaistella sp. 97-N-M2 TaxID=2908645 RepID=UPI001F16E6F9|nr:hypothetical protein [Kaistella sp. 97-N-M2]UJF30599.1 hypothetical protein L0B70_04195 [Kaistella sp. 97-N-M2]
MPLPDSALDLMQDLDLRAAEQDQPQHLDDLISALHKSSISRTPISTVAASKIPTAKQGLDALFKKRKITLPERTETLPEFEVEKTPDLFLQTGLNRDLNINQMFTVPSKRLGPFRTIDGTDIYYNFYTYINDFKIFFGTETRAAFIIPIKLTRILVINTKVKTLTMIKGNVWIRADLLDPLAPNDTYVGLRILSGSFDLGGSYQPASNSVHILPNSFLTIDLNLDNSFVADSSTDIGKDGKNSEFKPTDHLKLKSGPGRLLAGEMNSFSATTLGSSYSFTCTDSTFSWDAAKKYMCLSLTIARNDFTVVKCESDLYEVSGNAKILRSLWMLQSRVLQLNQSVEVKFNGVLGLDLDKGLEATWDGLRNQDTLIRVNAARVMIFNGLFSIYAESADYAFLRDYLTLWQKSEENTARMELEVRFMNYGLMQLISQSDLADGVNSYTDTEFRIDKPLRAENLPVHPKSKKSLYAKLLTKEGRSILIIDNDMLTEDLQQTNIFNNQLNAVYKKYQFALQNAYFTTTKESGLYLNGKYNEANQVYEGSLLLNFYILNLLPTLPHPYTSNRLPKIKPREIINGTLKSLTKWQTTEDVALAEVTFVMDHNLENENYQNPSAVGAYAYNQQNPLMINSFMLFDVSTESDHWGIALAFDNRQEMQKLYSDEVSVTGENAVTINRNYLQAPMGFLRGLTLPQVSWEPVYNRTPRQKGINQGDPDIPGPDLGILYQTPNVIPTIFSQSSKDLVRIHPRDYMKQFSVNLKNGEGNNLVGRVLFTLPNGKYSIATLYPYKNEVMYNSDHLNFIRPGFKYNNVEYRGGLQFRIAAKKSPLADVPPEIYGMTTQMNTLQNQLGISILGKTVTDIFNNVFTPQKKFGVPLTHIDFSGYGASTFSNWINPAVKFASISQAKFDILKGRTAHEIVQAVSVIYPWGICVTRTVTFLRNNNAVIFREDSGWVAQSDGLFDFSFAWPGVAQPFKNPYNIYPGMVQGLLKVNNIREDYTDVVSGTYTTNDGDYYLDEKTQTVSEYAAGKVVAFEFVAVYFNCDVDLDCTDENITGKEFKGYLQIKPQGVPVPSGVLKDIIKKSQNPVSGRIEALVPVEKTLQKFKTNAVEMSASYQGDNKSSTIFVASVKGSPILPPDGSWSVVEVEKNSGSVQNLKTGTSVGLVKDGLRPKENGNPFNLGTTKTLLAYADALKNTTATFDKTYGFLQNTDTQKLLLKTIEFNKTDAEKYLSDPALLADCFRLMNSKGPFPNLNDAIQIDDVAKTAMNLLPEGVKKVFNYKVPDNFTFNIVGKEGESFRIYLKYVAIDSEGNNTNNSVIDYVTDTGSLEKWANQMHNITVAVDLAGFKPLMYISGNFSNDKKKDAGIDMGTGPQLKLDKTLQTIYDILVFLNSLDPTQPAEAIKKGLKVAMSNSADSWEYKFKADQEIPLVKFPFDPINYNSPTTPLKLDAYFKLGVYFNQPIKIPNTIDQLKPSVGAYLELGADIRVMCVSLAAATVYAMGRAEVGVAADLSTPPTLYFKFGFGIELAVGLPVVGSVAVTYMVGIDMKINTTELIVGAFIYFRGRVEIFGGIVTVTISIEAAGQVQKKIGNGPTNCIARCTFALDISIAFVININFTETWEETRQIS